MFDMGSVRFVNVSLVRLNVKTCFKLGLNVTRVKTLKQINMLIQLTFGFSRKERAKGGSVTELDENETETA